MYKRDNPYNFEIPSGPPPKDYQGQARYWCKVLGITPDQLSQMSEQDLENRVQMFQQSYMRNTNKMKSRDDRHPAYQSVMESSGSPRRTRTPRYQEDESRRTPRNENLEKNARKLAAKKAAVAKVQRQLEEEAALEAEERQQRLEQERYALQQQQNQKDNAQRRARRSVPAPVPPRQSARSPDRRQRTESPQYRNSMSPTRQKYFEEQQRQQQFLEEQQKQKQFQEDQQRQEQLFEEQQRQQQMYEEQQRQQQLFEEQQRHQQQINEDNERKRYLKYLEDQFQRKQKELERRRLREEELLLQQRQQALDPEYQTDDIVSNEEGDFTEATEVEDEETYENDYEAEERLAGGGDTDVCGYDEDDYDQDDRQRGGRDMWGILSNAAENIEERYGQPGGPKASCYPPGKASYRIKGIDVNSNTFDLSATYDGPTNQTTYENKIYKKVPNYECGGQDYIEYPKQQVEYQRGGQDYCALDNYESSDDVEQEMDIGPNPRPNYMHMNPKVRTVSSYQVEYSEDAIDESEQNVTVENDGEKQTVRVQSRSFLAGRPIEFPDECGGYDDYPGYNPYQSDVRGTIKSNVSSTPAGKRTEVTKYSNQRDGTMRRTRQVTTTDRSGRTRKTAEIDVVPRH